jgi:hypothetical protein
LNSELEQHTAADTTVGSAMPPGQRGAAVADKKVIWLQRFDRR